MSEFDVNGYNSHECDIHNHGYYLGAQSQQAKIDELNEVVNGWKDEYRIMTLRYEKSKKLIDELQKQVVTQGQNFNDLAQKLKDAEHFNQKLQARIDEAIERMDAESLNSWGLWKEKADMYDQGASDAYERSYWILKGNKDEN